MGATQWCSRLSFLGYYLLPLRGAWGQLTCVGQRQGGGVRSNKREWLKGDRGVGSEEPSGVSR